MIFNPENYTQSIYQLLKNARKENYPYGAIMQGLVETWTLQIANRFKNSQDLDKLPAGSKPASVKQHEAAGEEKNRK